MKNEKKLHCRYKESAWDGLGGINYHRASAMLWIMCSVEPVVPLLLVMTDLNLTIAQPDPWTQPLWRAESEDSWIPKAQASHRSGLLFKTPLGKAY